MLGSTAAALAERKASAAAFERMWPEVYISMTRDGITGRSWERDFKV